MVDKKKSINKYKDHCQREIVKAEKFAGDNTGGLTESGKERAKGYIKDLQDQWDRMKKRWHVDFETQLEDEDEKLHDELEIIVNATSDKVDSAVAMLYDLIDKQLATNATNSASDPKALKLDKSWNPGILAASSNLEEYNAWEEIFMAHVDQNKDFLKAATPAVRRVFVTSQLDAALRAALATDTTVTDETPIMAGDDDSILKWLKNHILRHRPLFVRRFQYSSCKQKPKESFEAWWTRKLTKAKECELDTVNRESTEITELICGIANPKLREEILKLKEPKLEDLVALGTRFDAAAEIQKTNFNDVVSVNKTSDYKRGKNENFKYKKDADKSGASKSGDSKIRCKHCGFTPCRMQDKDKDNVCRAKDMECNICKNKGHIWRVCRKRAEKPEVVNKRVNVKRVIVKRVEDDCEATPTCEMAFKTDKGQEFITEVLPDTGCSQSIIAMDLVNANDMSIDKKRKKNW